MTVSTRRVQPAGQPRPGRQPSGPLAARLAALSELLGLAAGRLPEAELAGARAVLDRAAERLALPDSYTVVALAGPTGCGKSSLFNSIIGFDVSAVGVRRPTTTGAVACVWDPAGLDGPRRREGLSREASTLLDWLGVPAGQRFARASALESEPDQAFTGLVLLDLPDFDSAVRGHHAEAERLVGRADVVVWVTGPQKYADQVLHERHLRQAAHLGDANVVVLNQIDQLDSVAAVECVADLNARLAEDGLAGAPVVATSAITGAGLARLRGAMLERLAVPDQAAARIGADLDQVAAALAPAFGGVRSARSLRAADAAPTVAAADRAQLVDGLAAAVGSPAVAAAGRAAHLARSGLATGWPIGRWIREALPRGGRLASASGLYRPQVPLPSPAFAQQAHAAVRTVAESVAGGLPGPWAAAVRRAGEQATAGVPAALDAAVSGADLGLARTPAWWPGARMLQWALVAMFFAGVVELAIFGIVPSLTTPRLLGAPAPLALLGAGLLGGPLAGLVCQLVSRVEGGRRASRAVARLRDRAAGVADECVIAPIEAELRRYQAAVDQYAKLRSG